MGQGAHTWGFSASSLGCRHRLCELSGVLRKHTWGGWGACRPSVSSFCLFVGWLVSVRRPSSVYAHGGMDRTANHSLGRRCCSSRRRGVWFREQASERAAASLLPPFDTAWHGMA